MIKASATILSMGTLLAVTFLLLPDSTASAKDKPLDVGLYNVWQGDPAVHRRARLLVLRTKPNSDVSKREYGLVFMLRRGKEGRRGNALICDSTTKLADGLRCTRPVVPAKGDEYRERLTVALGNSTFCQSINEFDSKNADACGDEGYASCVCYEIKHFCDVNGDDKYQEPCPKGATTASAAAADPSGPPPAGSGRGGK